MALGDSTIATVKSMNEQGFLIPVSVISNWQDVIDADGTTGPQQADNSGSDITAPTTQGSNTNDHTVRLLGRGTLVAFRLGYDDALSSITNPVIQVFGRTGSDVWMRLYNMADTPAHDITLTTDATNDVTDGTLKYTDADRKTHVVDAMGCDEIIVKVKTALAGTGTVTNSIIQAKVF